MQKQHTIRPLVSLESCQKYLPEILESAIAVLLKTRATNEITPTQT